MTSKAVINKLAKLGFEYDEDVTSKDPTWSWWTGTLDPIGRMRVAGDGCCMGHIVDGASRAEMDRNALRYAKAFSDQLIPCNDNECDMHGSAQ